MEKKKSLKVLLAYMGVIIAFFLFLRPLNASAAGNIIYVKADASAGSNGSSWSAPFTDMQSAINAAASGDQIWVAAGTYTQGTTITLKDGVAIYGGFAGTETELSSRDYKTNGCTLDGNNANTVIYCSGLTSAAVLDGFTITNGSASYNSMGGGLYNKGGSPTLANLAFTNNTAAIGGGMYNENGSPTLRGVKFSGNIATDSGGGMYILASDCPTLIGVTFDGNSSIDGGGLFVSDSGMSIINAIFINNTTAGRGGGIFLDNYDYGSHTQRITNATFTKNSEALYIYANTSSAVFTYITNTIMWDNTQEFVINNNGSNDYQYYNVYNSIIAGSGGSSGWISSYGTNQGGNVDSDPLFAGSDDYTLRAGSPAIDSGTNAPYEENGTAYGVTRDIISSQRIVNGIVDMGAYEMAVGNISGIITHGADYVEGATVTVKVGSATLSTTTDSNGAYTLKSVPEGTGYTVTATANGNNASVSGVSITGDETTTGVDISLKTVITISQISGVIAPFGGKTPVTSITDTDQYTGTVTWNPGDSVFETYISYAATITLTPKDGFTLTNVAKDFFTVSGTASVSNAADSGVITAVFLAGEGLTKYNINEGSVTILVSSNYEIYGTGTTTANTITVSPGAEANITLRNVNIDVSEAGKCAFSISEGDTYLTITGDNILKSGGGNAGLYKGNGNLIITKVSDGTLAATGGSSGGAGIGSSIGYNGGCITINGGTITATGGSGGGAGIGSSYGSTCSFVTISGGTVTAIGGSNGTGYGGIGGAGIGSGDSGFCTSVGISGGKVTATGGCHGAGIGGGKGQKDIIISISEGTVTATGGENGAGIGGGRSCDNITITISGGTVTATGGKDGAGIGGDSRSTIVIKGGTVTAFGGNSGAGIGGGNWGVSALKTASITIESGTVTATGGYFGAGIGGSSLTPGGSITIGGGTITATGGSCGAGIGGGDMCGAGLITINGGVVNATGGIYGYDSSYSGAGIGCAIGGSGGTATINGGFVTANGNGYGQDIGYGSDSSGGTSSSFDRTVITGGSVYAVHSNVDPAPLSAASDGKTEYLVTVTGLIASTDVSYSVGSNETKIKTRTDASGNLYLWLPGGTTATLLTITDGTTNYQASGTVTNGTNSFPAATDECFIATAAFGSKLQPAVVLLRQFRDKCLLTNTLGKAFVKFYYHNSPHFARVIAQSEPLKALVRILLLPFIAMAYAVLHPVILWWLAAGLLVLLMRYRKKGKNKLVI